MARPRSHSGAEGPKEPHSVSLKGELEFDGIYSLVADQTQYLGEP